MPKCDQDNLIRYIYNELGQGELFNFESHLSNCSLCQAFVTEFRETIEILNKRERSKINADLLQEYRIDLKKINKQITNEKRFQWRGSFNLQQFSTRFRGYAIVLLAFVIGIIIGRGVLQTENEITVTYDRDRNQAIALKLDNYLVQTQALLRQITNLELVQDSELIDERMLSSQLLQSTRYFKIYKKDERQFIQLLNQLEMILLELANMTNTLNANDMESINLVKLLKDEIVDGGLILKIERFKAKFRQS